MNFTNAKTQYFFFSKFEFPSSVDLALPVEHGGDEGGAPAGAVRGEHQVEPVVDAHELADAGAHDVGEVRVEAEHGTVDGHHHVLKKRK